MYRVRGNDLGGAEMEERPSLLPLVPSPIYQVAMSFTPFLSLSLALFRFSPEGGNTHAMAFFFIRPWMKRVAYKRFSVFC